MKSNEKKLKKISNFYKIIIKTLSKLYISRKYLYSELKNVFFTSNIHLLSLVNMLFCEQIMAWKEKIKITVLRRIELHCLKANNLN